MGRRKRFDVRCEQCQMRREVCICDEIARCRQDLHTHTHTHTRIIILMHHRERVRTTNTARLATLALHHCEIRLRGLQDAPLSTHGLTTPDSQPLLLYPSGHATTLTPDFIAQFHQPITLIVPDGTWGQAAKIPRREPDLRLIPHVKIPEGRPSRYGLRRNPRENGLATFEAIARALGIIEGLPVQKRLEQLFEIMVTRTILTRGIRPQLPELTQGEETL